MESLNRNEMKKIKAGSGFTRCSCYNISGESEGTVLCSGLDYNQCCQLQHDETFAADCAEVEVA